MRSSSKCRNRNVALTPILLLNNLKLKNKPSVENETAFVATIGLSMFFMHQVYLVITIFSAISLNIALRRQLFLKDRKLYVPMLFLMAIINPLISHNGQLVLIYINGNMLTLEAITYGIAIATYAMVELLKCHDDIR